ncbi:hypothetical protein [Serratia marcescens]|uniref:hypothetical protein n=1 Tax=Serratia marcescens TaxID=615 RepID=UPI0007455DBF|nr:hypothetical protein [Serratia marcescens]CVG67810.1 Uncharacterised protein [Serratia marcescens]
MFLYRFILLAALIAAVPWVWFTFWRESFNMYAAIFIVYLILTLEAIISRDAYDEPPIYWISLYGFMFGVTAIYVFGVNYFFAS